MPARSWLTRRRPETLVGIPVSIRAAAGRGAAPQRQWRDRRVHRGRRRHSDSAGVRRGDLRTVPGRRGESVRPRRQRDRERTRRAGHHRADALDAGRVVERARRRAVPTGVLRALPGVWRHGDWIRFTPQRTCQVTGRSDATQRPEPGTSPPRRWPRPRPRIRPAEGALVRPALEFISPTSVTSRSRRLARGA